MAETSAISWTDGTFNPWIGCQKVSPGCTHCYAEVQTFARVQREKGVELWGKDAHRHRTSPSYWLQLRKWNAAAEKAGRRMRVFCASLADVFENRRDLDPWRADLFAQIEVCTCIDFLLLTKRPERMVDLAPKSWFLQWPSNAWAGTTVENQEAASIRIPQLLNVPAFRWLSVEPLLGPVDLSVDNLWAEPCKACLEGCPHDPETNEPICYPCESTGKSGDVGICWVIVGGESGSGARPMHPDWARQVRDECVASGVPFHYKQNGEYVADERQFQSKANWINKASTWMSRGDVCMDSTGLQLLCGGDFDTATYPVTILHRVGKKAAGRLLDGREWNEFPEVRP